MILFYNVCITPDASNYKINYIRKNLPIFDKIEILKYSLSSMAAIPWTKAFINIQLESYYKVFLHDIENYVEKEFKNINYFFNNKRASSLKEWQKYANVMLQNSEIIFYCGNHDHIFLSPTLKTLKESEKLLKDSDDLFDVIVFSHRAYFHNNGSNIYDKYSIKKHNYLEAIICIKPLAFWEFWYSFDVGNYHMPRSDWDNTKNQFIEWNYISFHEILCEHFDGSSFTDNYPINYDPPLVIPAGFFENNIKINFGFENKENYFNINPLSRYHKCKDISGVDAYWTLDNIPLFWKNRISDVQINSELNYDEAKKIADYKNIVNLHPEIFTLGQEKLKIETILKYKKNNDLIFEIKNFIKNYL